MTNGQSPQPTPGPPVGMDLSAVVIALSTIEKNALDDAQRIALLTGLETLVCAATGAQAAVAVEFETSQIAARTVAGVRAAERGRGIADHVGLARRESGHRGTVLLGLARTVMGDLPHLARAWRAGLVSEHRVQLVTKHAHCLAAPERRALDQRLAGTSGLVEDLAGMGNTEVEETAAQLAYELDRGAVIERRRKAVGDRHTRLRRAADGMAWFSALVPLKDGVAMHQSLAQAATAVRNAPNTDGDAERSFAQVMADTLVDRVTGRTDDTPIPVHVEIVVPVDVATGTGEHADGPCWSPAYGHVPADVAREWAEDAEMYTRIWADAATGQVIGTESTSQARLDPPNLAGHARSRDRKLSQSPGLDPRSRPRKLSRALARPAPHRARSSLASAAAHNYAKQAYGWSATTSRDPDGTHVITYTTPTGESYASRPPPAYPPRK